MMKSFKDLIKSELILIACILLSTEVMAFTGWRPPADNSRYNSWSFAGSCELDEDSLDRSKPRYIAGPCHSALDKQKCLENIELREKEEKERISLQCNTKTTRENCLESDASTFQLNFCKWTGKSDPYIASSDEIAGATCVIRPEFTGLYGRRVDFPHRGPHEGAPDRPIPDDCSKIAGKACAQSDNCSLVANVCREMRAHERPGNYDHVCAKFTNQESCESSTERSSTEGHQISCLWGAEIGIESFENKDDSKNDKTPSSTQCPSGDLICTYVSSGAIECDNGITYETKQDSLLNNLRRVGKEIFPGPSAPSNPGNHRPTSSSR